MKNLLKKLIKETINEIKAEQAEKKTFIMLE
jgi:hypothetical protein